MRDIFVLAILILVTVWLVPTLDRVEIIKDQSEQRITRLESLGK